MSRVLIIDIALAFMMHQVMRCQSRRRCGRGEPSPGADADVGGGSPVLAQTKGRHSARSSLQSVWLYGLLVCSCAWVGGELACLFVCLFVYLFICLFVYLFICLFVHFLFVCLFVCLLVRLRQLGLPGDSLFEFLVLTFPVS